MRGVCKTSSIYKQWMASRVTHGAYVGGKESSEHAIWRSMIQRCKEKRKNYEHVKVCKRWAKYESFIADMGPRPTNGHTLDRYPNNHGDYKQSNCRWATWSEQHRNKRATRIFSDGHREGSIAQWSEWLGISRPLLRYRWVNRGTLVYGKTFWVRTSNTAHSELKIIPKSKYRKDTKFFEQSGVVKSLPEWAEELGMTMQCAFVRMKKWGTFEKGKVWHARP